MILISWVEGNGGVGWGARVEIGTLNQLFKCVLKLLGPFLEEGLAQKKRELAELFMVIHH